MTKSPNVRPVLVTDLDGTLIPLPAIRRHAIDLDCLRQQLTRRSVELVFATGRHAESVQHAIRTFDLPQPDWVICDVGTSILCRGDDGTWGNDLEYQATLDAIVDTSMLVELRKALGGRGDLELQESVKQGRFKVSLYCPVDELPDAIEHVRRRVESLGLQLNVVESVDPYHARGLIDILPADVSKAFALAWWAKQHDRPHDALVYAGDSGNDYAALVAGYRTIVVGNASSELARRVQQAHRDQGWHDRLFLANDSATSGVLAGCRWFGLAERAAPGYSQGAIPVSPRETHFRLWAPYRQSVKVEVQRGDRVMAVPMVKEAGGYFTTTLTDVTAGARYRYRLDAQRTRPDPVSRFQRDDVHAWSEVVSQHTYPWQDQTWQGVRKRDLVIYELHIGTFTHAGTFAAAMDRLAELQELGVTAIELLPLAQAPGRWNWGYDGVQLFAVRNTYGSPDDFKALVDASHALGMAVIVDVVYNHLGPEGNYLAEFGPYFSSRHRTPWGTAFNFDGPDCEPVRQCILDNATMWFRDYHVDGLRLDAAHFIVDESPVHLLASLRHRVESLRQELGRPLHVIAETNVYDACAVRSTEEGGWGVDAMWCDDLMHSLLTIPPGAPRLTNREYRGVADVASILQYGHVYQHGNSSEAYSRVDHDASRRRVELGSLVKAIQTHDSVGNHPLGQRIHTLASPRFQRASAALMLLYPSIPLLFMGEEFAAPSPFLFFVDFLDPQLRRAIERHRKAEFPDHDWTRSLSPIDERTFQASQLPEREAGDADTWRWYRSLIATRKAWQAEELLHEDRLSTEYLAEHHLFVIGYAAPQVRSAFLAVRLGGPADAAEIAIPTGSDGCMLLDSERCDLHDQRGREDSGSSGLIRIAMDHAIVGRGRLDLAAIRIP